MTDLDIDWLVVFLDIVILTNWALLAQWFRRSTRILALDMIALCFALILASHILVVIGDVFLALDYTKDDIWLLARPIRALVWRTGSIIGFTGMLITLKYGSFSYGRGEKNDKR